MSDIAKLQVLTQLTFDTAHDFLNSPESRPMRAEDKLWLQSVVNDVGLLKDKLEQLAVPNDG